TGKGRTRMATSFECLKRAEKFSLKRGNKSRSAPVVAIKTIVLDFGNVVAFFDHRLPTNRLAPYAGISADALHAFLFHSMTADSYEAGSVSTTEFLHQVRQVCGVTCTDEFFFSAWADIFWPNRDVIAALPGLKRRYRLLLASNTNEL